MTSPKILTVVDAGQTGSQPVSRSVLVVDLDETLIRTDSLHEQLVQLFFRAPARILNVLPLMFRSKALFKAALAKIAILDTAVLPLHEDVVSLINAEKSKGTRIVLCTAANESIAKSVAGHLGLFDKVIASNAETNMKGPEKAARLTALFPDGFTYVGDSAADLDVWRVSTSVVLVNASASVRRQVQNLGKPIQAEFSSWQKTDHPLIWAKALRIHHWSKNLLIFIPLLLGHFWFDLNIVLTTFAGFLLLVAVTSSSYLINDLADLETDRRHFTKRLRPLAQGSISILVAVLVAGIVLPLAIFIAFWVSIPFAFVLSAYLAITLLYSFRLKRIPLLDLFTIAILFTSRLLMGMTLLDAPISRWLLIFALFFFFSLATAKRHVEIIRAKDFGAASLKTRGYEIDDAPLTLALGIAAGLGCLIIMVLYMIEEAFVNVTYNNPGFLWAIPLVLAVWIGRIWLLCHRGILSDDPVSFALRDRASLYLGGLVAAAFIFAL